MHLDETAQVSRLHPGHTSSKWSGRCWAPLGGKLGAQRDVSQCSRLRCVGASLCQAEFLVGTDPALHASARFRLSSRAETGAASGHCSPCGGACGPSSLEPDPLRTQLSVAHERDGPRVLSTT